MLITLGSKRVEIPQFFLLWLIFMVCRAIHVTTHYLRLDPYGFPIVARVDRFLKFALVAEAGALFCVLFLAMFIATLFKRVNGARLALVFGGGYLLLGIFDLEVYRYLRQHINLAYIRTYQTVGVGR